MEPSRGFPTARTRGSPPRPARSGESRLTRSKRANRRPSPQAIESPPALCSRVRPLPLGRRQLDRHRRVSGYGAKSVSDVNLLARRQGLPSSRGERVACRSGRGRAEICARPGGGNRCLLSADGSAAAAEAKHRMVRRGLGRPSRSFDATAAPAERVRRPNLPAAVGAFSGMPAGRASLHAQLPYAS